MCIRDRSMCAILIICSYIKFNIGASSYKYKIIGEECEGKGGVHLDSFAFIN